MPNFYATSLVSMSPFGGLFVCMSITFVHCDQMAKDIDTISFAYDDPMSLPDRDPLVGSKVKHKPRCSGR